MGEFITFKIFAERSNGTYAEFTLHNGGITPSPELGTAHGEAHKAEINLHQHLVRVYQGGE